MRRLAVLLLLGLATLTEGYTDSADRTDYADRSEWRYGSCRWAGMFLGTAARDASGAVRSRPTKQQTNHVPA